jgi:predicted RNA-binding Zn ribbon-like protein
MGDWVWDGGRPSVDLLNTVRDRTLGGRETLHTAADLAGWLAEAGLAVPRTGAGRPADQDAAEGQTTETDTDDVPAEEMRADEAHADPADTADLDAFRRLRAAIDVLAVPAGPSRVTGPCSDATGAGSGTPSHHRRALDAVAIINASAGAPVAPRLGLDEDGRPVSMPPVRPASAALARVAMDAIDLLTGDELVRVCAAYDCGIRFVDRSPARNRQWCSMRRCGNRTKARRHYARARG